jgi:outer membrane protein OmpA-like peptidoglycan-associated protein
MKPAELMTNRCEPAQVAGRQPARRRGGALFAVLGLAAVAATATCGSKPPPTEELIRARSTYDAVSRTSAAKIVPDKLLTAKQALARAEAAQSDDPGSERAKTLAYVADRKARLARALAGIAEARKRKAKAEEEYKFELERSHETTRRRLDATSISLERERQARAEVESRYKAAVDSLDEIAKVREEARGTVITLSGSVLFSSDRSELLPIAREQLNRVAEAIKEADPDKSIVIEGHTDSRGSASYNERLSFARADAVRNYLVGRGLESNRIRAVGRGEEQPIATNATAEGRANNRRVEIVIGRDDGSSSTPAPPAP